MEGHVSCGAGPDEEAVFVEISREVTGRSLESESAVQRHVVSLHHRKNWTLQDHRTA